MKPICLLLKRARFRAAGTLLSTRQDWKHPVALLSAKITHKINDLSERALGICWKRRQKKKPEKISDVVTLSVIF